MAPETLNDAAPDVEATSCTPPLCVRSEFSVLKGVMVTVPNVSLGRITPNTRSLVLVVEIAGIIVAVHMASAALVSFSEEKSARRQERTITFLFMGNLPFYFHEGGSISARRK